MARLRLKELAEERGLNMSQLQRRSGLTMGMVRRYWLNETGEVSLEALDRLAALLDVNPGELLVHEGEQTSKRAA